MQIEDIKDEDSLRTWLEEQNSPEISVAIAARAALRVQPWLWTLCAPRDLSPDSSALPFFWSSMSLAVFSVAQSPEMRKAVAAAVAAASVKVADFEIGTASENTYAAAARATADAHPAAACSEKATAAGIVAAVSSVAATVHVARYYYGENKPLTEQWAETLRELPALSEGDAAAWKAPLWQRPPAGLAEQWVFTREEWEAAGAPWGAFARIYDDFWVGRAPDWTYLERIVLIEPEIWEAGPEAVAREIARIEEQMRLLAQVEELRSRVEDLTAVVPADAGLRSDNLPEGMEPLDAPAEVARQVMQLRIALGEAQRTLAKPKPSRSELERAASSLFTVQNALLAVVAAGGAAVCAGFMGRAGEWLFDELILNGRLEALARQIQAFAAGL